MLVTVGKEVPDDELQGPHLAVLINELAIPPKHRDPIVDSVDIVQPSDEDEEETSDEDEGESCKQKHDPNVIFNNLGIDLEEGDPDDELQGPHLAALINELAVPPEHGDPIVDAVNIVQPSDEDEEETSKEDEGESCKQRRRAKATKIRVLRDLFHPLFGESWQPKWGRPSELPKPLYTIGKGFAKQEELREEAVQLGVELSLYADECMFLVCDDIRSVLLFCNRLWLAVENDLKQPQYSPMVERLLRVFHYVCSKHIKPKNGGVFRDGGTSLHWKLAMAPFEDFHAGIRDPDVFVREGSQEFTPTSIDDALKNIEEKLGRAKAVSKANGFERNAMESDVLIMWKSLFDKPSEDLWALKMKKFGILNDMFHPLLKEREEENSFVRSISCLNICN
ncbi:hypothetical protein Bca101_080522 [Brassica carinata]